MFKKLNEWLFKDLVMHILKSCPMLGNAVRVKYKNRKALFGKEQIGWMIPMKLAFPKQGDPESAFAILLTTKELDEAVDRLYKHNQLPVHEALPVAFGMVHREPMFISGGCLKSKFRQVERFFLSTRYDNESVFMNLTKDEINNAIRRWNNCTASVPLRWWHKWAMKKANKYRWAPPSRPYDFAKGYALIRKKPTEKKGNGGK